jgi:nucleoside-diphosphate-sugar epimerase
MNNILLIGSTGNLGFELKKYFVSENYRIFTTSKTPTKIDEIYLESFKPIVLPKNLKIDLIINAANKYFVHPKFDEINLMKDAIIGVSQSIVLSNMDCPIVYFSTYLQYLPNELQPWSEYTEMKLQATEIINDYGSSRKVTALEVTLYDNYGGKRKNKFFDLALDSVVNKQILKATKGESVINLTHICDIAKNLETFIKNNRYSFDKKSNLSYSMQTNETFSLKDLIMYIGKVSKKKINVEWGVIPYRNKEVFHYYKTKPILPGFYQTKTLESYILSYLK